MPLPSTENASEAIAVLASLGSASVAVGTAKIGPVSLKLNPRVLFMLDIGVISGGATVDAKLQGCATSGGTFVDIANGGMTQVTVSASNKVVKFEIKAETLAALGYSYAQLLITVGTAAVILSGKALAGHAAYAPNSDNDNAVVVQTVVV